MFNRREFIKRGLLNAVGKQPDFWVILNADAYAEKGVLEETDLEEIQAAIDASNAPADEAGVTAEEVTDNG